jgi:hypothetical protein
VCYCPDFCSYFIEVVSPSRLAVKSPAAGCFSDLFTAAIVLDEYEFTDILLTPEWRYSDTYQVGRANADNFFAFGFLEAQVHHGTTHIYDGACAQAINIDLSARIRVYCGNDSGFIAGEADPTIAPMLEVRYFASFGRYNRTQTGCVSDCIPYLRYDKIIRLPSECFDSSDRRCSFVLPPGNRFRYIKTPLDITVDSDGVTVGGEFFPNTNTVIDPCGPDPVFGEDFRDFINSTVDRHTATFRITSRPSCQAVDCSCGQNLSGVSLRLYGETFTVGNEPNPTRGGQQQTWDYTDSTSNPVIEYKVWNQSITEEKYYVHAEVFCDSEQQAGGVVGPFGKDAWYLTLTSDCFEWEDGSVVAQTRNTYVGAYSCYESCEKSLPSGTPLLMYLVSSVDLNVGTCSPLPAAPVIISPADCPE